MGDEHAKDGPVGDATGDTSGSTSRLSTEQNDNVVTAVRTLASERLEVPSAKGDSGPRDRPEALAGELGSPPGQSRSDRAREARPERNHIALCTCGPEQVLAPTDSGAAHRHAHRCRLAGPRRCPEGRHA
jgi:hypothetical protein